RIEDANGQTVERIDYGTEGDWAARVRGALDFDHEGWNWFSAANGFGSSLERIDPRRTGNTGQNWASSLSSGGTPGQRNSVFSQEVAPFIVDVIHAPAVPHSGIPVLIAAEITDPSRTSAAVVNYRQDGQPDFLHQSMTADPGAPADPAQPIR